MLVFFDDILVYNRSKDEHLQHLILTLDTVLSQHQLYAKQSKCSFGYEEVAYLRHLILAEGVRLDPEKLSTIVEWPKLAALSSLSRFLGLTGYYRIFIKGYGRIAAALTQLLNKW